MYFNLKFTETIIIKVAIQLKMSTKQEFRANYIINTFELEVSVEDVIKILKKCNIELKYLSILKYSIYDRKANGFQYFYHTVAINNNNVKIAKGLIKTHIAYELWNKLSNNKKQEYKDKAESWTKPEKENKEKCVAKTKSGNQCKNNTIEGYEYCNRHLQPILDASSSDSESKICEAVTAKGEYCKYKVKKGEDYCSRHLKSGKNESKHNK